MADLTAQDIVVSILNGDQDAALVDIGVAIQQRIDSANLNVEESWWVHLEGRYFTPDTATPRSAARCEKELRWKWDGVSVREAAHRYEIVLSELVEVDKMPLSDARAYLDKFKPADLTWGETSVVNPPKDDAPDAT